MKIDTKTALIGGGVIIGVASTALILASSSGPDGKGPDEGHTIRIAASSTPSPSPTGPQVHGLTSTAHWGDITLTLKDFRRGSTDEYGVPEDTDYIRFTAALTNDGTDPVDLGEMIVNCTTQQVYDSTDKLEGVPAVHVLPSKSLKWDMACALDKDTKYFQVELTPEYGEHRTAIFSGTVK